MSIASFSREIAQHKTILFLVSPIVVKMSTKTSIFVKFHKQVILPHFVSTCENQLRWLPAHVLSCLIMLYFKVFYLFARGDLCGEGQQS